MSKDDWLELLVNIPKKTHVIFNMKSTAHFHGEIVILEKPYVVIKQKGVTCYLTYIALDSIEAVTFGDGT